MDINDTKIEYDQAIAFLKKELSLISTGRADPSLLEDVGVNVYDSTMKLQELASITVPEPNNLLVELWDKSIINDVAASLEKANLDGQIKVSGDTIRFIVPQMTEENRIKYVKIVKEKLELARISLRRVRDKAKDTINQEEKSKEISEDEKFTSLKSLDELTNEYNNSIKTIGEQKESEILKI